MDGKKREKRILLFRSYAADCWSFLFDGLTADEIVDFIEEAIDPLMEHEVSLEITPENLSRFISYLEEVKEGR